LKVTKVEKVDHINNHKGSLKVTRNSSVRYSVYYSLLAFHGLITCHCRNTAKHWLRVAIFNTPRYYISTLKITQ